MSALPPFPGRASLCWARPFVGPGVVLPVGSLLRSAGSLPRSRASCRPPVSRPLASGPPRRLRGYDGVTGLAAVGCAAPGGGPARIARFGARARCARAPSPECSLRGAPALRCGRCSLRSVGVPGLRGNRPPWGRSAPPGGLAALRCARLRLLMSRMKGALRARGEGITKRVFDRIPQI